MMQRARKLIGMSQDDLSSFRPRSGRIRDRRRPAWPATAAVRHPGDGSRRGSRRRADDAPRRGDICMCLLERI
jgi:hypothetical protein